MFIEGRRLVLRYNPGQFTLRHVNHAASDEQLYNVARAINAFQEGPPAQILRIRTRQF